MNQIYLHKGILLKNLYVIGGGRWARIVLGEAIKLSNENLSITVVSDKNFLFMKDWIRKKFTDSNICVIKRIPDVLGENSFIYVLNETALRYETLTKVSKHEVPVLVEKPLGLNYDVAENIISVYKNKKVPLMSAQVFRFLESTSIMKDILEKYVFQSILLCWADPYSEVKPGDIKKYEKLVPPFLDILPHVFSLLEEIIGEFDVSYSSIIFNNIEKDFCLGLRINSSFDLEIKYSRIAPVRARNIEFFAQSGSVKYDFSENETITKFEGSRQILYNQYKKSQSIQLMLKRFLSYWESGIMDTKFSHKTNILALQISQDIQNSLNSNSTYKP